MDFAKLTGQPAVIDESLEAFECKPEGYENGAGDPLVLTMHPAGGTRFKKAVRKMHIKVTRSGKEAEETSGDLTEDELEAEIRTQDSRTSELLARCCDGWNMTDGKKPIPYTVENGTELFKQVEPLRSEVDGAMTARGKSTKAKKTA
ncbi:hypothetical protein [Sulfitobacter dubius]|uniref:Tail assembly chaperone n=1 Tax=Sulfitobacter dubius TaxID=218673 RepID=A0ABY3ZIL7_9RHOB|nr:hypothetical protein [Sulfitobacter dubius]UOA14524.1 hypothetical protein DSM109990_01330 [Sulfitobacter dubius]